MLHGGQFNAGIAPGFRVPASKDSGPPKELPGRREKVTIWLGKNPANMQTNIVGLVLQYCPRAETLELMMVR